MFSRTRFRLTAWYTAVMVAFVTLLGTVVFYVVQAQLRGQVDTGMRAFATRIASDVATDIRRNEAVNHDPDLAQLQEGTLYQFAVSLPPFVTVSQNQKHAGAFGLPNQTGLYSALQNGIDLRSVQAPDGPVRVYSVRKTYAGRTFVVQVSRSTVPEHQSLENLLIVLLVGGGAGLVIAAVGGWFLAGKSLKPVREAFERQRAFVGDASHELRTPLAVIRANAEYLQAEIPDSIELADIVSETDRLSALVDALLALARGEAGDRPPADVFDIGTVVEQTVDSLQPLAAERGLGLAVTATRGMHVSGDREQLRQLIVILVDNALRYTPRGGTVEIDVARLNGTVAVAISDTGIGIEHAELEKVFDRFYRADEARNRDSGGTGLGLSIARQLADEHGGRITVESSPGKGSTFTVRLPSAESRQSKPNVRA